MRIILECILEKQIGNVQTGCIWLNIGTGGGLLHTYVHTMNSLVCNGNVRLWNES
jgi:hypothetical protein